uniref:Mut7-C RNAse domain-containing protein n=1 Tax=Chromera velia CCMP2878 TaxID=1169474 RepID=A0A0G4FR18_9ALVE|eukprot:Cvel_18177.t1-p1 / transcript=Cvel_18177.t1 / gene=Cvel_18177 / organism=Chromera_velia_CCMP2878 / gene_product=hypothetical protein / transcript_product=hypothetical protein / location=Cvel_scaffold1491:10257-16624(+) / protein_length=991 / sequence_SO=supercontig / SO=protein_coding / is_pseudo=false
MSVGLCVLVCLGGLVPAAGFVSPLSHINELSRRSSRIDRNQRTVLSVLEKETGLGEPESVSPPSSISFFGEDSLSQATLLEDLVATPAAKRTPLGSRRTFTFKERKTVEEEEETVELSLPSYPEPKKSPHFGKRKQKAHVLVDNLDKDFHVLLTNVPRGATANDIKEWLYFLNARPFLVQKLDMNGQKITDDLWTLKREEYSFEKCFVLLHFKHVVSREQLLAFENQDIHYPGMKERVFMDSYMNPGRVLTVMNLSQHMRVHQYVELFKGLGLEGIVEMKFPRSYHPPKETENTGHEGRVTLEFETREQMEKAEERLQGLVVTEKPLRRLECQPYFSPLPELFARQREDFLRFWEKRAKHSSTVELARSGDFENPQEFLRQAFLQREREVLEDLKRKHYAGKVGYILESEEEGGSTKGGVALPGRARKMGTTPEAFVLEAERLPEALRFARERIGSLWRPAFESFQRGWDVGVTKVKDPAAALFVESKSKTPWHATTLYLGGLPSYATEEDILQLLESRAGVSRKTVDMLTAVRSPDADILLPNGAPKDRYGVHALVRLKLLPGAEEGHRHALARILALHGEAFSPEVVGKHSMLCAISTFSAPPQKEFVMNKNSPLAEMEAEEKGGKTKPAAGVQQLMLNDGETDTKQQKLQLVERRSVRGWDPNERLPDVKFLCDHNLAEVGLGQWLRVAGYDCEDVKDASMGADRAVQQAIMQERVLLCAGSWGSMAVNELSHVMDAAMNPRKPFRHQVFEKLFEKGYGAQQVKKLYGSSLEQLISELNAQKMKGLRWTWKPLSRCVNCNHGEMHEITEDDAEWFEDVLENYQKMLPEGQYAQDAVGLRVCKKCRAYSAPGRLSEATVEKLETFDLLGRGDFPFTKEIKAAEENAREEDREEEEEGGKGKEKAGSSRGEAMTSAALLEEIFDSKKGDESSSLEERRRRKERENSARLVGPPDSGSSSPVSGVEGQETGEEDSASDVILSDDEFAALLM